MSAVRNVVRAPSTSSAAELNLASVDLNLLVALEALLDQCNVTHAAHRVGLSQPAMSRALSRLRFMFNDDLLVRTSAGLVRTARGQDLNTRLPPTLGTIRDLVGKTTSEPQSWQAPVRMALADHQAFVLLPALLRRLNTAGKQRDLVTEPLAAGALKRLESGEVDFAIGQLGHAPSGFFQRTLYTDGHACLLRRDHPALARDWDAEAFYGLQHAVIAPGPEAEFGRIFDALARILPDRNRVVTPNIMSTPMMLAETDLALTVPARVAAKMAAMLPLVMLDLPVAVAPHEVALVWHERSHRNTEHAWVRGEIAKACV